MEPTKEKMEAYLEKLLNKLKQDPLFELRSEFGRLLMRHINSFSETELKRYNELKELLKQPLTPNKA